MLSGNGRCRQGTRECGYWYDIRMPKAKKNLSQNFLFDPSILRRIVRTAGVAPGDTVLEVGPGPGSLTAELLDTGANVVAVELDREMVPRLRAMFATRENFTLHEGDFMKFPLDNIEGTFRVVANIPYHITTPIIFRLLEERQRLRSMTLTVQKELAERAAASPGGKDYGVLSVMLQYHGAVRSAFTIPRGAFRPVPKVDSACLHMEIASAPTVDVPDPEEFRTLVKAAFSQRRKTLGNSLKQLGPDAAEAIAEAGVDPRRRPETLSIEEFASISRAIHRRMAS